MTTIYFVISKGIVLRNFNETNLWNRLRNSFADKQIVLLISDEFINSKINFSGEVRFLSLKKHPFILLSRRIFYKLYPNETLKILSTKPLFRNVRWILSRLVSVLIPKSFILLRTLEFWTSKYSQRDLDKIVCQNAIVVFTDPCDSREIYLSLGVRDNMNLKSVSLFRSWDNVSSKGYFDRKSDLFIVWNERMKTELKSIVQKSSPIYLLGAPHMRQDQTRDKRFTRSLGYILYMSVSKYINPCDVGIMESLAVRFPNELFVVKLHQMDDFDRWSRLRKFENVRIVHNDSGQSSNLRVSEEGQLASLNSLISNCALIINTCSTTTLDALLFDKPVIGIGFNGCNNGLSVERFYKFSHYQDVVKSGLFPIAYSETSLFDLVIEALKFEGIKYYDHVVKEKLLGPYENDYANDLSVILKGLV